MVERLLSLNMACTTFSNPTYGDVCRSLKNFQTCVKQESVYFVICPKQGPNLERVALQSDTPLLKHGSLPPPYPNHPHHTFFQLPGPFKIVEFAS